MSLLRHVGTLVAGTAFAQVLSIAALPVLTRLYAPADFGVLAFFASVAMLVGLVSCGRYELAVPLPEEDAEARDLLRLATTIGLVSAGIAGLGAVALALRPPALGRFHEVAPSLVWLPASLVLTALYQPFSYWFTRKHRFRAIAGTRALQSGGAAVAQIAFALAGRASAAALVVGTLLGQAAATAGLEIAARRGEPAPGRFGIPRGRTRSTAVAHRGFPLYTTGAGLLQLATDHLPIVVIPILFGTTLAGTYALSARILQAAVVLLSGSTAQAFYPLAARERREGHLAAACLEVHRELLRWTVAPILLAAVVAPDLFARIFGGEWEGSGRYFRLLVPWFLVAIPFAPISQVLLILERQRAALVLHALVLVAVGAALLGGAAGLGADGAILLFSVAGAATRGIGLEWTLRVTGASPGAGLAIFGRELLAAAPLVGALLVARWLGLGPIASIASAGVLIVVPAAARLRARLRSRGGTPGPPEADA